MFKTSCFNDDLNMYTQIYAKKQENLKIDFANNSIIKFSISLTFAYF